MNNTDLWDAINHYCVACGGSPATRIYGNVERQRAVVAVEKAICETTENAMRRAADAAREPIPWPDLRDAVNASCTCGGKGPRDPGVCPACMVWHRLGGKLDDAMPAELRTALPAPRRHARITRRGRLHAMGG